MPSLAERIRLALAEDIPTTDVTTEAFVSDYPAEAVIIAKADGVFCGGAVVATVLGEFGITPSVLISDGTRVFRGTTVTLFSGPVSAILKLERVLLNLIQHLSGIATQTRRYVEALDDPAIQILDTRKTTPMWRDVEKQAVLAGGGFNHRHSLSDMVLIKENHLADLARHGKLGDLRNRMAAVKTQFPGIKIEIEIENNTQLETLDLGLADYILLDNYPMDQLETALTLCKSRGFQAEIEVSGNITLDNIGRYKGLPIHRISCGSLTHSVPALDLSLRFSDDPSMV
ncbi:MAG: carboxylating nicotinate-nucleotide diphosphorylase [Candidatus Margulisiibacteriota bacterium]